MWLGVILLWLVVISWWISGRKNSKTKKKFLIHESSTCITKLPESLIIYISDYVPMNQSRKNRRVCQKWNQSLTCSMAQKILKWKPSSFMNPWTLQCSAKSFVIDFNDHRLYILIDSDFNRISPFNLMQIWDLDGILLKCLVPKIESPIQLLRCNKQWFGFFQFHSSSHGKIFLQGKENAAKKYLPFVHRSDCVDFRMSENSISILSSSGFVSIYSLEGSLLQQWNIYMSICPPQMIVHKNQHWIVRTKTASVEVYSIQGIFLHGWSLRKPKESIMDWYACRIQIAKSQLFVNSLKLQIFRVFDLSGQFLYDIPCQNEIVLPEFSVSVSDSETRIYICDNETMNVLQNWN